MVTDDVVIRQATTADRAAVVALVRDAFGTASHDPAGEVEIVVSTWASERRLPELELVAEADGVVVGHVLCALGDLEGTALPGVAPLAVAPASQSRGIGTALMTEVVRRAETAGYPALVLIGSDRYYRRFDFEPAGALGVVYAPVGPASPHFQIRRLAGYDLSLRGEFAYHWELGR